MNIVVLGGGMSTERDVSLRSAAAVARTVRNLDYKVIELDPANGLGYLESVDEELLVMPILHGTGGEDGVIQKFLEDKSLPFLGTGSEASAICFDKHKTRQALMAAGLPVAKGDVVTAQTYYGHELAVKPHVLKVNRGGSSIGTLIVSDVATRTAEQVENIFMLDSEAILEELVTGTEITVPILDAAALPVIEIRPPVGKEFDYENKYNGQTQELCLPQSISAEAQQTAAEFALKAHQALRCRHLSRVDMILRPDGTMVILEINTMPGMTEHSLYPKSAQVAGLVMEDLMQAFIKLVVSDSKSVNSV